MNSSKSNRAIVFDAVGTLIYARPTVAEVYHQIASQVGWSGTLVDIKERFAIAFAARACSTARGHETNEREQQLRWREIVGCVFSPMANDTVDRIFEQLWKHFAQPSSWEVYPDAAAAVELCERHGIPWYIGSNFDSRLQQVVAGHLLLSRAERVFCSSEVGFDKPAIEFFRCLERDLSLPPEQLTMIGDDWRLDVQAARLGGWKGLWIDRSDPSQQVDALLIAEVQTK